MNITSDILMIESIYATPIQLLFLHRSRDPRVKLRSGGSDQVASSGLAWLGQRNSKVASEATTPTPPSPLPFHVATFFNSVSPPSSFLPLLLQLATYQLLSPLLL
jgi:hypothetical protein